MENHSNINRLTDFLKEIEDLKQARELLSELWFMTNAEDCVKFELSRKVNTYFGCTGDDEAAHS
jgi:hypothetical protein